MNHNLPLAIVLLLLVLGVLLLALAGLFVVAAVLACLPPKKATRCASCAEQQGNRRQLYRSVYGGNRAATCARCGKVI